MRAAVVSSTGSEPEYAEFREPEPASGDALIQVNAAALSRLARAQAAGQHYSSTGQIPFVPGVDGVGRTEDGTRVYFAFPRAPFGAMAERTVVAVELCVPLPEGLDEVTAAAIANPGMSSWAALTDRARLVAGEGVLIHGATGASGRLAIQIARHLGAARVVATGRTTASLEAARALGADRLIPLDGPAEQVAQAYREEVGSHGVSIVLDYLWGEPAATLLRALSGHGGGIAEPRVRYIQIGSVAGAAISLDPGWLRSSGVELLGSGLGSVSNERLVAGTGAMLRAVVPAGFRVDAEAVPLRDVKSTWNRKTTSRVVFTT